MNLEDDLRRALKRTPAPDDFADRIIASIAKDPEAWGEPDRLARAHRVRFTLQWLTAAAAVTLMAAGGANYYRQQQAIAEAERVQAEIQLAMQITSDALARVQAKLQDTGR